MNFNLSKPCDNCPFRTEPKFYLDRKRAEEIASMLLDDHAVFHCHKTIDYSNPQVSSLGNNPLPEDCGVNGKDTEHCAGAAIILQKIGRPNIAMRLRSMFGGKPYDMKSPVYNTFEEFINEVSTL